MSELAVRPRAVTRITIGVAVTQALLTLTAAQATPTFTFTTERGTAEAIRNAGNRWLKDQGIHAWRLQVGRTNPYTGNTYSKTQWEARLVKRDTQ